MTELTPWDSSDRITADGATGQTGEIWLRLFRRSVAVPETGFKAAFLLCNTVVFSMKSLCHSTNKPCVFLCLGALLPAPT